MSGLSANAVVLLCVLGSGFVVVIAASISSVLSGNKHRGNTIPERSTDQDDYMREVRRRNIEDSMG